MSVMLLVHWARHSLHGTFEVSAQTHVRHLHLPTEIPEEGAQALCPPTHLRVRGCPTWGPRLSLQGAVGDKRLIFPSRDPREGEDCALFSVPEEEMSVFTTIPSPRPSSSNQGANTKRESLNI